jgi:hypothetical protein
VAGEGSYAEANIWLGVQSSEPLSLALDSVVPESTLTISWQAPLRYGCLTILSYTLALNGVDHITLIDPSL